MQSDEPDHYAALGLDGRCTPTQIRAAYRLLAKRHHPDLNGFSAETIARSQELNAAYEILSDPVRRRAYDRERTSGSGAAPIPRGKIERNIRHEARLRIEEFLRGTTLEVHINDPANPSGPEIYTLTVPPHTAPGSRFRLPREASSQAGFVQVRVRAFPSARFKVRGSDLRCDLRISARRAADGGTEILSGPTGAPLRVTIPPGIARGEMLRIAGEGLPMARGGRGDLLVRVTYRPEVRISRRP